MARKAECHSVKKRAGDGKNALLAALSVNDLKHVVVVDEDIPKERYERISYAYAESAKIADYLAGKSDSGGVAPAEAATALADRIYAATPMDRRGLRPRDDEGLA